MKVGFIGLGIMGSRMAANLQKNGYELVVHNRTRAKAEPLIANGAHWADSPAQAAVQVPLLFTMLSTPDIVRQIALGPGGILERAQPGMVWVDASTVNPSFSLEMAGEARKRQVHFVDAPVVGTKDPAEKGQLVILVGAEPEDLQVCQPCLAVMGRQVRHVGGPGAGSAMKMLFAILLGQSMLAFSEAMLLGESWGLSRDLLFDTLLGAPVTAPFLAGKRKKIEGADYAAEFPLQWMRKDLNLAAMTGVEKHVGMPSTNLAKEIYGMAAHSDLAEMDFSAIYRFLEQRSADV